MDDVDVTRQTYGKIYQDYASRNSNLNNDVRQYTHSRWEYVDGSERIEDFNNRVKNAVKYLLEMEDLC